MLLQVIESKCIERLDIFTFTFDVVNIAESGKSEEKEVTSEPILVSNIFYFCRANNFQLI